MEPQRETIRAMLAPELIASLSSGDAAALRAQCAERAAEDSPTASWLESIGTRLQIRDFLLQQKEAVAALQAPADSDIGALVTGFMHTVDADLAQLIGLGEDGMQASPEQVRQGRFDRLGALTDERLLQVVDAFTGLEPVDVLFPDELIHRTVALRNGMAEQLGPVAQTSIEGDTATARQELALTVAEINRDIDHKMSGLVSVET